MELKNKKNSNFFDWITSLAIRMNNQSLRMTNISKSDTDFPKIGDISPDCPINWYLPFYLNEEKNWGKLWKNKNGLFSKEKRNNVLIDDWYIINNNEWGCISYIHRDKKIYPKGHGHEDQTSFSLYYKKIPLIIDIGRKSYDKNLLKKEISGVEAKYHNCIIINGKGILNKKNLNQSNQSIRHLPNKLLWEIENPLLKYKRRLLFNKNIVVIKDDFILMKKGYYKIEGNLNLDSKWQVSKNQKNFFLSKDNESLVIELIGISSSSLVKGFNYPQYGLKESIQSIRWELNVQKEDKFSVVTNIKLSS